MIFYILAFLKDDNDIVYKRKESYGASEIYHGPGYRLGFSFA